MNAVEQRDAFMRRFGSIYEASPWVAEALWEQRQSMEMDNLEAVAAAMALIVDGAGDEAQTELILAHPELAGKAAQAGELGAASATEQSGSGLDQCSPEELKAFTELNAAYRERFGFPFIIAVSGLTRRQILDRFRERLGNEIGAEKSTAMREIHRIAQLRLTALDGWNAT